MDEDAVELLKRNKAALDLLQDEKTITTLMSIKGMFADRMLERGDLRFLILDTISEKPKNGYQVIASISKKFFGLYKPSPGVIYPSLQSLVDGGLISVEESGGKKLYDITKKGKLELKSNRRRIDEISTNFSDNIFGADEKSAKKMEEIMKSWVGLAYEVFYNNLKDFRSGTPEAYKKMVKINTLLKSATLDAKKI